MLRLSQAFRAAGLRLRRLAVPLLIAVVVSYLLGGLLILAHGAGEGQGALTAAKWSRPPIAVAAAGGEPP